MSIVTVDFDGTLYQHNSVMAMLKAGRKAFTLKQWILIVMNFLNGSVNRTRGNKMDFRVVLLKSFFYQMKGKSMDEMHDFFESIAISGRQSINYDLVSRIAKHLENGDRVIILSGALQPFLEEFIRQLDMRADAIGTSLLYDERGICTGEIGRLNHGVDKVNKLKLWIKENDASGESIWAYADSESDISLLEFADKAVVVQPSNAMKKIAESKGWEIFYN
ncbi:MAG TPA: HAD family hydrolase [Bacillota bacterium]|nr:HAD family hydrolase [Bacillota bacterium]